MSVLSSMHTNIFLLYKIQQKAKSFSQLQEEYIEYIYYCLIFHSTS
jgi:hypothetical protein